nr:Protein UNC-2, isoform e [Haemonchus contortus]
MVVGRAFALRRQSLAPPLRRPKEANRSKSRDDSISAVLPRGRRTSDRKSRPSLDFPTAVLEAARRASLHPNTSPRPLDTSSTCSSTFEEERLYSSPARRRVVNVSDHKTCALLMTRMKEANRLPSPSQ